MTFLDLRIYREGKRESYHANACERGGVIPERTREARQFIPGFGKDEATL